MCVFFFNTIGFPSILTGFLFLYSPFASCLLLLYLPYRSNNSLTNVYGCVFVYVVKVCISSAVYLKSHQKPKTKATEGTKVCMHVCMCVFLKEGLYTCGCGCGGGGKQKIHDCSRGGLQKLALPLFGWLWGFQCG